MALETGDIIIFAGTPGHVGMVYSSRGGEDYEVIHAQRVGNFHIDRNIITNAAGTDFNYFVNANDWVFRPPWTARPQFNREAKQAQLQAVARDIRDHAQYGVYRAIRLFFGSSTFGDGARARLNKYKQRRQDGFPRNKFVTTISCSEAVILCYQMSFEEDDEPFFIKLDAAHSMPKTLKAWLATRWTIVQGR